VQDVDCFASGLFLGLCFVGGHDGVVLLVILLSRPTELRVHSCCCVMLL
jgi:hypothetical protein